MDGHLSSSRITSCKRSALVTAVGNRDVTEVQSVAMLIAIVYVMVNLLADLIVLLLVPKLREPA